MMVWRSGNVSRVDRSISGDPTCTAPEDWSHTMNTVVLTHEGRAACADHLTRRLWRRTGARAFDAD
jgi:hypothetical protein